MRKLIALLVLPTIPAPSLTAGHYVLEWSIFARDSKVARGRIRFTVGPAVHSP